MVPPNTCWSPPEAIALKKEIISPGANEAGDTNGTRMKKADARHADTGLLALFGPISDGPENERHFAAFHFGILVDDGYIFELGSQLFQ